MILDNKDVDFNLFEKKKKNINTIIGIFISISVILFIFSLFINYNNYHTTYGYSENYSTSQTFVFGNGHAMTYCYSVDSPIIKTESYSTSNNIGILNSGKGYSKTYTYEKPSAKTMPYYFSHPLIIKNMPFRFSKPNCIINLPYRTYNF